MQTPLTKQIRDADRLSRMGIAGLVSILEGNNYYGDVPFYLDGDEIIRVEDAPIISFDKINSNITDINSCTGDWEKMMETSSGRILAPLLTRVNRQFLRTFVQHQEIRDYMIWLKWLRGIKQNTSQRRLNLRARLEQNKITIGKYIRELVEIENPQFVSAANFTKK